MAADDLLQELKKELDDLSVDVSDDRVLSSLLTLGSKYNLRPSVLADEWLSFSANGNCPLNPANIEKLSNKLYKTTPTSNQSSTKLSGAGPRVYTKDDLYELFGESGKRDIDPADEENMDLMNTYAGATPTRTPRGSKRLMHSSITPVSKITKPVAITPVNKLSNDMSPSNHTSSPSNSYLADTPSGKYCNRTNKGRVSSVFNGDVIPHDKPATSSYPHITLYTYDNDSSYTNVPRHMYMKTSEQATVLIERLEEIGGLICEYNQLETCDELMDSPPVVVGMIGCDGDGGRLNTNSCSIEVIISKKRNIFRTLELVIPQSFQQSCSLFPGQIVAVEGQLLEQSGTLVASKIFDEGCLPPVPYSDGSTKYIQGFTMLVSSGPYTTSDSLDMAPLHDLLSVVSQECPSVLLLMGPFLDSSHQQVQNWSLEESFNDFVVARVLSPIVKICRRSNTQVVIVPSQRDITHPWMIYPQPPFIFDKTIQDMLHDVKFVSDPSIITINDIHVGVSSTDILFHLNSQALFLGHNPDRMSKLSSQLIRQQSFYPLYPPFCRENDGVSHDHTPYTASSTEINFDLRVAYESGRVSLPILPDLLVLTSDLKPFTKVVDGCLCVNTGRLTKKAGGGTYSNVLVKNTKIEDLIKNTAVQITYI